MDILFRYGDEAHNRGVDITLSLTPDENRATGGSSGLYVDWLKTALLGLAALREGTGNRDTWYWTVNDLETHLIPSLQGIRDAAIRQWANDGGSYGDLGLALNAKRSTAQYRRDQLTAKPPQAPETWVFSGLPKDPRMTCPRCGNRETWRNLVMDGISRSATCDRCGFELREDVPTPDTTGISSEKTVPCCRDCFNALRDRCENEECECHTKCGSTSFCERHEFTHDPEMVMNRDWETCDKPADDPIHSEESEY